MSGEEDDKPRVSQLCKPLWNCLHDQSPLSILEYFIQFMTTRKALHLLQFWFSVASFKNALPSSTTEAPISSHHSITPTTSELLVQGDIESRCERSSAGILPPSQTSVEHNNQAMAGADNTAVVLPKAQNDDIKDHSSCHVSSSVRQSGAAVVEVKPSGCCGDGDCGVSCVGGLNGLNGRRGRERDGDKPEVVRGNQSSMESQREGKTSEITRQTSLNVVTDAIGIYSTYIALNALTPVHMPDDIRQRVEVNICPEDGIVDRTCFNEAQQFVYDLIENQYYPEFLRSPHLCKYQLELVSSGKLCLLDFLLGGDSLVLFMEFMEQENAMSLLQFWLTAESFYTHFSSQCNVEATVQDAIAIYDRYFSLQAKEPLCMGDRVRVDIELGICNERGPLADSFIAAQQIAYDKMIESYYPSFLESGVYLKFLDHLIHTVKVTSEPQTVSENNTQHAPSNNGSCQTELKSLRYLACDVDDPESLWRRPQLLMRLGCVDKMGQYCSEIEPFPAKTAAKARENPKHFRWFRNTQEQEEWELAVKISRNIIAKVLKRTSQTSSRGSGQLQSS